MARTNMSQAPMPSERVKKAEELKKNYNNLREKDRQKVKGKFIFHEVPGGSFSFCYGPIYKGDETERYDFLDQEVYEIPLGVARHLNKNGWYPEYGYVPGETGVQQVGLGGDMRNMTNAQMRIKTKVRRFSFQSLEFVDIDEVPTNNIMAVETVSI
jgi:hypothetical protein